ncbi:MAG: hypothetical protein II951_05825 [Bacteroidales bacterium]|nr:hypothetical protein [Bacteroidales bacterium]
MWQKVLKNLVISICLIGLVVVGVMIAMEGTEDAILAGIGVSVLMIGIVWVMCETIRWMKGLKRWIVIGVLALAYGCIIYGVAWLRNDAASNVKRDEEGVKVLEAVRNHYVGVRNIYLSKIEALEQASKSINWGDKTKLNVASCPTTKYWQGVRDCERYCEYRRKQVEDFGERFDEWEIVYKRLKHQSDGGVNDRWRLEVESFRVTVNDNVRYFIKDHPMVTAVNDEKDVVSFLEEELKQPEVVGQPKDLLKTNTSLTSVRLDWVVVLCLLGFVVPFLMVRKDEGSYGRFDPTEA